MWKHLHELILLIAYEIKNMFCSWISQESIHSYLDIRLNSPEKCRQECDAGEDYSLCNWELTMLQPPIIRVLKYQQLIPGGQLFWTRTFVTLLTTFWGFLSDREIFSLVLHQKITGTEQETSEARLQQRDCWLLLEHPITEVQIKYVQFGIIFHSRSSCKILLSESFHSVFAKSLQWLQSMAVRFRCNFSQDGATMEHSKESEERQEEKRERDPRSTVAIVLITGTVVHLNLKGKVGCSRLIVQVE